MDWNASQKLLDIFMRIVYGEPWREGGLASKSITGGKTKEEIIFHP